MDALLREHQALVKKLDEVIAQTSQVSRRVRVVSRLMLALCVLLAISIAVTLYG